MFPETITCSKCPMGTWSDTLTSTDIYNCNQCPAGKFSGTLGRSNLANCNTCGSGKMSIAGSSSCTDCPQGTRRDADLGACVPYLQNYVVKVTDHYRTIFRSGGTPAVTTLKLAETSARVKSQLMYDSATREELLWHHLSVQTTGSCQDLVPLLRNVPDMQDQYEVLVRLLMHDGPCAPGFIGYDLLQDPGDVDVTDSECVMIASTAQDTGRDALLVLTRRFMGRDATNQFEHYDYSAQYLTPTLVRHIFGSSPQTHTQVSFCNVRNVEHAPAAVDDVLSHVALWTMPQNFSTPTPHILAAQLVQSGPCPS